MSLMLAIKVHAVALAKVCSQSFANLRQRPSPMLRNHFTTSASKPAVILVRCGRTGTSRSTLCQSAGISFCFNSVPRGRPDCHPDADRKIGGTTLRTYKFAE